MSKVANIIVINLWCIYGHTTYHYECWSFDWKNNDGFGFHMYVHLGLSFSSWVVGAEKKGSKLTSFHKLNLGSSILVHYGINQLVATLALELKEELVERNSSGK